VNFFFSLLFFLFFFFPFSSFPPFLFFPPPPSSPFFSFFSPLFFFFLPLSVPLLSFFLHFFLHNNITHPTSPDSSLRILLPVPSIYRTRAVSFPSCVVDRDSPAPQLPFISCPLSITATVTPFFFGLAGRLAFSFFSQNHFSSFPS